MAGQCYVSGRFGSRAVEKGGTRPRGREVDAIRNTQCRLEIKRKLEGGVPKGPSGEKRPSCPSGCQGANPMQCIFPVNQLADAGAVGAWLRLIAMRSSGA